MKAIPIITPLAFLLSACVGIVDPPAPDGEQQAWVPVYATPAAMQAIDITAARPTLKPGKIYSYGSYVFQNEIQEGVHIIDRSGAQPKKIAFLKIPFSTEIAVKGHYLYANSVSDMVVIDIANPQQPTIVKRLKDAFPPVSQDYPPYNNVYFECVDHSKGIVVDWELKTVKKVTCRR
ncbi:hypothetical protein [Paraflavitalea sp. CAU 1676]|uniref:hypothetical protein n=1 Tax=Paraflavitalea sp. CAU 1676 TaxID=3032598 RepID=UPI0023D9A840|nr:hypothetical protein [Paraflavitalea sp. CAU 1676]MDF2193628.1 hypothetical protein [Paraflavitalea sp. CAU 1676]